jgi:uncharacterized membrane protein AbrB (regulator of aidB expression)
MSGAGVAVVGLLLCFAGLWSIHLALLTSGFALGWLLAESLGGSLGVVSVVALCAAVAAWFLATVVFKAALMVVGGIAGAVIGARLFGLLQGDDGSVVLAVLFTLAVGAVVGIATQRFSRGVLAWACAFGGAGLVLSGLARAFPDQLDFLRYPETTLQAVSATVIWVALGGAGWWVQRRLVRDRQGARA